MSLRNRICSGACLIVAMVLAPAVRAETLLFVQIDTNPILGTTGWLDLQFNPGAVSWQDAFVDIREFATDGSLLSLVSPASPDLSGGVTGGPLPATLTLHNSGGFNDYFQNVVFGRYINFTIALYGGAIDTPDQSVFSGSSFSVGLYGDDQSTPLLAAPPLFQLDIKAGGGVSATNNAPSVVTLRDGNLAATPEPSSLMLCAGMLAVLAIKLVRRQGNK